ncbi:chemotaxis protein CheB [Pseudanabaenaceae cyanobacterium LEGE 13415]|nr:chemotaxis protein CheB [Pseudanabaenaceae cyanobacterium LEGE 13415]
MTGHHIIAIGASAGGVTALTDLVKHLPSNLNAAIFVVVHFPPHATSLLPQILNRLKTIPACHPEEGDAIEPGRIYIAPPNYHLMIRRERIHLDHGARENGHRPAIDTMFRSIAHSYGRRVIGVILTGTLDDGTAGLLTIKTLGGTAIVQDPDEALFDGMPCSAINTVKVDDILKIREIAERLIELSAISIQEENLMSEEISQEGEQVAQEKAAIERGERTGLASAFTCPDCGGVLWELQDQNLMRYRCHVGHAYSVDSLPSAKDDDLERALWTANRALEEKAALARRMATQARRSNHFISEEQFLKRAAEVEENAAVLKQVLLQQMELKLQPEDNEEDEN